MKRASILVYLTVVIGAWAAVGWLTFAQAEEPEPDGNHFLSNVTLARALTEGTEADQLRARTYLAGVSDAGAGTVHCSGVDVGTKDVAAEYLAKFTDHSPYRNAAQVASAVLAAKWPCPRT